MKNGPVVSNISLINKAFLELGSPLHYKLIVDYLRINWEHGKGLPEGEAKDILNIALNAKYYYEEVEEQHFQRKQAFNTVLDDLYKELKHSKVPIKQHPRKPAYKMTDLYSDPRFTIMVTEENDTYILLSEWNLLNDLVLRLFIKEKIVNISIFEALQLIKQRYQITDRNALFFPHFDHRFTVTRNGKVSLKSYDESQLQTYSIEVTSYIREEVARRTPKLVSLVKEEYGEEVKIRTLIRMAFHIEAHTPKFPAYFVAVKEHLQTQTNLRLSQQEDSFLYIEKEEAHLVNKVSLQGVTDTILLEKKVQQLPTSNILLEEAPKKVEESQVATTRTSLAYTLRYYDRIQETLAAHYFYDWIKDDELQVELVDGNESSTMILFYNQEHKVLHGTHLENLMSDYALVPGQKLLFQLENNRLMLRIGHIDECDSKEQERYVDIARLVEENKVTSKSLLHIVTETLIYHPSGLHVSEIIRLVKEEAPYANSSITALLSTEEYFEKIPGQSGFWRFNPAKWRKNKLSVDSTTTGVSSVPKLVRHRYKNIKPMDLHFKESAAKARKRRRRLTNEMYYMLDREAFINLAWENYANNIYNFAQRYASPEIPLEDYFQEAYFALEQAYENYNPSQGGSFYNYFKLYLSGFSKRYQQNHKNLIRIPIHRVEELEKLDKKYELELLDGNIEINENLEFDYTIYKTNYISFEDMYIFESDFKNIEDEAIRGRIYSYFNHQGIYDKQCSSNQNACTLFYDEPEQTLFHDTLYVDQYNLIENAFFLEMWEYVDEKARSVKPSEVLKQRFGMNQEDWEYTLEQIGKKFGVTRERIRQLESKGLERARFYCKLNGYKPEHFGFE